PCLGTGYGWHHGDVAWPEAGASPARTSRRAVLGGTAGARLHSGPTLPSCPAPVAHLCAPGCARVWACLQMPPPLPARRGFSWWRTSLPSPLGSLTSATP